MNCKMIFDSAHIYLGMCEGFVHLVHERASIKMLLHKLFSKYYGKKYFYQTKFATSF